MLKSYCDIFTNKVFYTFFLIECFFFLKIISKLSIQFPEILIKLNVYNFWCKISSKTVVNVKIYDYKWNKYVLGEG